MTIAQLLILFALLQLGDTLSTRALIRAGGYEAMPSSAWVMDRLGFWTGSLALKLPPIAAAAALVHHYSTSLSLFWTLAALCAGYAGVIAWNVRLIVKLRAG